MGFNIEVRVLKHILYNLLVGLFILVTTPLLATPTDVIQNKNSRVEVDISGNWQCEDNVSDKIQVREPAVERGATKLFWQQVKLSAGEWSLKLKYVPDQDLNFAQSLGGRLNDFAGLSIDGKSVVCDFKEENGAYIATVHQTQHTSGTVRLELRLINTRVLETKLCATVSSNSQFQAPIADDVSELLNVGGIPFSLRKLTYYSSWIDRAHNGGDLNNDRGILKPWVKGGITLDCHGAVASKIYFLGMIHNIDLPNASWYCSRWDHGYEHFIGDTVGGINIAWQDGTTDIIPLVMGFNMWYGKPWDMMWFYVPDWERPYGSFDHQLFGGEEQPRKLISDALMIRDGVRVMGSRSTNSRYIFPVLVPAKPIKSISIVGVDGMYDYPLISAITLETITPSEKLMTLPELSDVNIGGRIADLATIHRGDWKPNVAALQRQFYTFVHELPNMKKPEIPNNYFGAGYNFVGAPEALYMATFLYRNSLECASHIADSGTGCASTTEGYALAHYNYGMGVWRRFEPLYKSLDNWITLYHQSDPGQLPGKGEVWSRGAGELIRESMAFGYDKFIDTQIDWLDSCLYSDANPPHWIRMVGTGARSSGYRVVKVGDLEERGNRENDGHGICMWSRYMVWHWGGRSLEWNRRHFEATKDAVNWIIWQLETDMLRPGVRKNVLFTESECTHSYDIYSTYNCLHGLKLSIRMAEQLGEHVVAAQWNTLLERLKAGVLDHLVDSSEDGPIWHTDPGTDWQDHAHRLVPIQLYTEGDSYTPVEDAATADEWTRKCMDISVNSYRSIMKSGKYDFMRMLGYGQGLMLQSALLLDQMHDATKLLNMLVTHCYLPNMGGWCAPEGIITHKSGEFYMPVNGYSGQDSHLADAVKACRVVLGVDDNNPEHLRIVPRYPDSWRSMSVSDYFIMTGGERQKMAYQYDRRAAKHTFSFSCEQSVPQLSVRFGPFSQEPSNLRAECNGADVSHEIVTAGDSFWVWVRDLKDTKRGEIILRFNNNK